MAKLDIERWAVLGGSKGHIVVVFERPNTSRAWAQWVADGRRGRRVARIRITEIAEPKPRAATKRRSKAR